MNLKSVLLVSALAVAGAAQADLLSYYNFNDASSSTTGGANATDANRALLLSADGGTLAANTTLTSNAASSTLVGFAGTLTNAVEPSGTTPNVALAIQNGTSASATANNGANLTLSLSAQPGTTLSALTFSFAGQATSTGFQSIQLATSTNGGAFADFGSAFTLNSSTSPGFGNSTTAVASAIRSFDLSSLGSDVTSLSLRLTFSPLAGQTTPTATGNNRLDNFQVNGTVQAVPEPSAFAALGLGAVALLRRRSAK